MTKLEELQEEAFKHNINVIDYSFESPRIKGLYCDGSIALNKKLDPVEKSCVLAEEIGHHLVNVGNILDQSLSSNRRQEQKARMIAYNRMIGISGIISAFDAGCRNAYEMAEHLDVSEAFLKEALEAYKAKYNQFVTFDNYVIYFEPYLGVFKLI